MLSSALICFFISALAVSAEPKLSITVTGDDNVNGVDNLKVIATLRNIGDETMRILNDPRGPLSNTPTNTFTISNVNGTSPTFTGVRLKYAPKVIIGGGRPESFTVLAPGEAVKVTHDLSMAYNFTHGGVGSYNIESHNLFLYVDPKTNTTQRIRAQTIAHKAHVSGKLSVARERVPTDKIVKRARFRGCNDDQIQSIFAGAKAAQSYASSSLAYLKAHPSATERYTTWWGEATENRQAKVLEHFTKLAANDFLAYDYDCKCKDADVFAFVYPDDFGVVHLCGAFWTAPVTGTDSQGGTIFHESSHFTKNAGTDDHAYGQTAAKALAVENPDEAIDNADSHEYFVENNPALE